MSVKPLELKSLIIPQIGKPQIASDASLNMPLTKSTNAPEIFTVTQANTYDDKMTHDRFIPTGAEVARGKVFLTADDYKKSLDNPMIKKARTLAYIYEFLFDLAYVPFIKLPLRDYNGGKLYGMD